MFFLAISGPYLLWPWVIVLPEMADPESQRWFAAQWGVLGTFFGAIPLMFVMFKPRQNVNLMQYWVIGFLLISLFWFVVGEKTIDSFVILAILGCFPRLLIDFNNTLAFIGGSTEDMMLLDNFTHEINIVLHIALGGIFVALKHAKQLGIAWWCCGAIMGSRLPCHNQTRSPNIKRYGLGDILKFSYSRYRAGSNRSAYSLLDLPNLSCIKLGSGRLCY